MHPHGYKEFASTDLIILTSEFMVFVDLELRKEGRRVLIVMRLRLIELMVFMNYRVIARGINRPLRSINTGSRSM
jgi:hypothetical protein